MSCASRAGGRYAPTHVRQLGVRRWCGQHQNLRGVPVPSAREQFLPVGQHRAADVHRGLAPTARGFLRVIELVGDAGAAHERRLAVHDQQFAVVAKHVAEPLAQMHRVVEQQFNPGAGKAFAVVVQELCGAEVVGEHLHQNTARGGARQRFDKTAGDHAGLEQVDLKKDEMACQIDCFEHARKIHMTVYQQLEAVAAAPGKLEFLQGRIIHPAISIVMSTTVTEVPI